VAVVLDSLSLDVCQYVGWTGALLTVMESAAVAVAPVLSATFAVKFDVPDVVGVPVIAPLEATMDNPAGSEPEEIDQVRGLVPPEDASVWL
jgi:hypothetical protein